MDAVKPIMDEIAGVSKLMSVKGWAERNAGNISVNITNLADTKTQDVMKEAVRYSLPFKVQKLTGNLLLITSSGSKARNISANPEKNLCLVYICDPSGYQYISLISGTEITPSSELFTHLAIHNAMLIENTGRRVVLHSHVTELIALTQIEEFNNKTALNNLIWGMHPETIMYIPEGVGYVKYCTPGSSEIAALTAQQIKEHNVIIWEKHGACSTAANVYDAFDLLDIIAKSAGIFFKCRSAGYVPTGITPQQNIVPIRTDSILK